MRQVLKSDHSMRNWHLQLHPVSSIAALLAIHPLEWQMLASASAMNARPDGTISGLDDRIRR